ncbi:MAG: SPOR domain-containing protein [Planctomycetota bacterium]|nr:MAG: SPOR domain-containing protein [Planctomycetota bacterium]
MAKRNSCLRSRCRVVQMGIERLHYYRAYLLASALSVSIGCTSLGPAEREALIRASDMYSRGNIDASLEQLNRLIQDHNNTIEISEAYYVRGLCRTRRGRRKEATEDFERAIQKSKREDLTAHCRASLATLAYRNGKWGEAAELYEKAIPYLPDKQPKDVILYCAGKSLQRIGKWKKAAYQFGRILRKFRSSRIASDARRMAGWRHEYFSIQLGAFKNADNATDAVRSYRSKRLEAIQEYLTRDGGSLWVVRAGRYKTYKDALAALPRARKIQPKAIIIPY